MTIQVRLLTNQLVYKLDRIPNRRALSEAQIKSLPSNSQISRLTKPIGKVIFEFKGYVQQGTSVILDKSGIAVTALHVLKSERGLPNKSYILLTTTDGKEKKVPFTLLNSSQKDDLAIIQLSKDYAPYPYLSQYDGISETGEHSFTLGFTAGTLELDAGKVVLPTSDFSKMRHFKRLIDRGKNLTCKQNGFIKDFIGRRTGKQSNNLTTNYVHRGCSGGALLGVDGRMRGVVVLCNHDTADYKRILRQNFQIAESEVGDPINYLTVSKPMALVNELL